MDKMATILTLDDKDAKLFLVFMKHRKEFEVLFENRVFDDFIGQITVHKNGLEIKRVDTLKIKHY